MSAGEFYLQDSRTYCGNDLFFWAAAGGYTTDVSKAEIWTKEQALAQHRCRETDIPWPKAYIDAKTRPAVDMQYVKRDEALAGTGIELIAPQRSTRWSYRCESCGVYLSAVQIYTEPCPKCGASNAP